VLSYLPELFTVALVHCLAVVSPGPDFIVVVKNSVSRGRRHGIFTAIGIAASMVIHTTYSLLGVALVISRSIFLFNVVKALGACYLLWIGVRAILSQKAAASDLPAPDAAPVSPYQSAVQGLLTNALNPKATLLFLSLFSLVVSPETPLAIKILYGAEMTVATGLWFSFVAVFLTVPSVQRRYQKFGHWLDRVMGAVLLALGAKILLERER
jgi:RhtB (resistance to homoserine/threonine) family protein